MRVRLHGGESATRLASRSAAGKNFVDAAVFRLQVLDLHDVFEAVDGAAEVDLPHRRVRLVAVLARVNGPLAKQRRVSLLAVAALLCVDPGDAEDGLLRVYPLESVKAAGVYHPADPVTHTLRSLVVIGRGYGRQGRFVYG